jgi:hypothetical protein
MKLFFNVVVVIGLFALSIGAFAADATLLKPPRGAAVAL